MGARTGLASSTCGEDFGNGGVNGNFSFFPRQLLASNSGRGARAAGSRGVGGRGAGDPHRIRAPSRQVSRVPAGEGSGSIPLRGPLPQRRRRAPPQGGAAQFWVPQKNHSLWGGVVCGHPPALGESRGPPPGGRELARLLLPIPRVRVGRGGFPAPSP